MHAAARPNARRYHLGRISISVFYEAGTSEGSTPLSGFFLRHADFSDSRLIAAQMPFVTGKIYAKSAFFQKKTPGLAGGSVFGRFMDSREPRNEKFHSVVVPIEDERYGTEEYGFKNVIDQRVSSV